MAQTRNSSLELLRRQYLQMVPVNNLSFDCICPPVNSDLQTELYEGFFSPVLSIIQSNSVNADYTRRVLKQLITKLEQCISKQEESLHCDSDDREEIDDRFYDLLGITMESTADALELNQKSSLLTYTIPGQYSSSQIAKHNDTIVIEEKRNVLVASGHTGSRTWEAALAYGEFLIQSLGESGDNVIQGKTVLELGAGTGFLSILAVRLGAKHVVATDGDSNVCDNISRNVARNFRDEVTRDYIEVKQLFWGGELEPEITKRTPDIIIGADITYDQRVLPDLVKTIGDALAARKESFALIAATVRNAETVEVFENACCQVGLAVKVENWRPPTNPIFFYPTSVPIKLITIRLLS